MKKIYVASSALLLLTPFIASAQQLNNIVQLISSVGYGLRLIIPILIVLAIIAFFWGLVKYIWGQGKDTAAGKNTMIAGLVSLFVMITLYGILQFGAEALGIKYFNNTGDALRAPRVTQ
ncbi:hypothetical protein A2419_00385 [Candidatus Adlerbacteria bacterium RIFOXYC1_FULL_48_26]|uniref:DUF4190 domain-containing protein n=1 Tax=Candidatus Adlerbacteria bacterium RIFOXYC1_FULL_48_26 TaxID=1797247 RepID=A0A1F4Y3F5_9BACT|nr:MAG: hypothetical protein A2419_00385 [Candidatus Adlerbacteria bacterium RIFOXYC1_FULL_48_26]OGC93518.1 MAG: hypothetical protein A2389_03075 [Candidatus Adlerbacteria bacterium RIFOXYB1_FULL_48_10]